MISNMKNIFLIGLCLFMMTGINLLHAQNSKRPNWTYGMHRDLANSYIEESHATGPDEGEARDKAATEIIKRRIAGTGLRTQVQVEGSRIHVTGGDNGTTVKSRVLDTYTERLGAGEWRVYLLVQTAKNPELEFEDVAVTDHYKFSPAAFVPGLAQFKKGSTAKGLFIIGGEVAFIGGIIWAENQRATYNSKINTTHNTTARKDYIDKANNYETMRNVMIGGAVAVYLYNIIDAVASKGKKHVVVLGDAHLDVNPFASPMMNGSMASGVSLTFTF
jgi:hypothetical protein